MQPFFEIISGWKTSWEQRFQSLCRYFQWKPIPKTETEIDEDFDDRFHLLIEEPLDQISRPIDADADADVHVL